MPCPVPKGALVPFSRARYRGPYSIRTDGSAKQGIGQVVSAPDRGVEGVEAVVERPDREVETLADDGQDRVEHGQRRFVETSGQLRRRGQVVQRRLHDGCTPLDLAEPTVGDGW